MAENSRIRSEQTQSPRVVDLALVLAERLRVLLIVPSAAALAALAACFIVPPSYTAVTRILPPVQQQSMSALITAQLGALASLAGSAAGIKNPGDQYVALLRSHSVYDSIIERFNLRVLYDRPHIEDVRKQLDKRIRVTAGVKDGLIVIEAEDSDPKRAADLANAFVEELRILSRTLAITEAAQRRLFFETQLKQARDNLTGSELALRASGVSEATLKAMPQSALDGLARLRAQITAHEVKLSAMRMFMTDTNPQYKLASEEIAALRAELLKAEQSNTTKAAGRGTEYIGKYRDFKYHEALFELMAKQYELARLDEAREGALIQVVDVAKPPERKSAPRTGLVIFVVSFLALVATVLFVLAQNAFRNLAVQAQSAETLSRIRQTIAPR